MDLLGADSRINNLTLDLEAGDPAYTNTGVVWFNEALLRFSYYQSATTIKRLATLDDLVAYDLTNQNIVAGLGYTPLNKAGDILLGSLGFPKAIGTAIKIESQYGWKDLIGDISPKVGGSSAPALRTFIPGITEYSYQAADAGSGKYHLPHDYAPGTDLFLHVHWGHNGTNINGTLRLDYTVTYASGHGQGAFSSSVSTSIIVTGLSAVTAPSKQHMVSEIQLSTPGGSSSLLDTDLIEVDGLILFNFVVTTIPSISGSAYSNAPYLFTMDLHMQSTGLPTKNRLPSFYA